MSSIIEPILILSLIVASGFLVGRFNKDFQALSEPLSKYVFRISLPCLVFSAFIGNQITSIELTKFDLVYFISLAVVPILSQFIISRSRSNKDHGKKLPIVIMLSSYTNSMHIGLPLLIQMLGSGEGPIKAMLIQTVIVMPIVVCLLEQNRKNIISGKIFISSIISAMKTPLILSSVIGAIFFSLGIYLPHFLKQSINMVGNSAVPCALFSLGLFIATNTISNLFKNNETLVLTAIKLFVHPLIVLILASLLSLPHDQIKALVAVSALPPAISGYILSREYGVMESTASATVCLTTILTPLSLIFWMLVV